MNVTIVCPRCAEDIEVSVEIEGGDWVPYGSTQVRTPSGPVAEYEHDCPGLTDAERAAIESEACAQAEDVYDGPDEEDIDE